MRGEAVRSIQPSKAPNQMPNVERAAEQGGTRGTAGESLLVHVAFHFVPHRWQFLAKVLTAIGTYRLSRILIVVDSNSPATAELIETVSLPPHCELRLDVHAALPHPFDLTWAHRMHMASAVGRFDCFMYLEDDIEVPWSTFEAWKAAAPAVDRAGFVRGFLRIERDREGRALSSDWRHPMSDPRCVRIDGRDYVRPDAFYQACWACTATQMQWFVDSHAWSHGFHRWSAVRRGHRGLNLADFKREFAAFGLACARAGRPRILLPLNEAGQIAQEAWISHLPNNYVDSPDVRLIGADGLLQGVRRRGLFSLGGWLGEAKRWCIYLLRLDALLGKVKHRLRRVRSG